MKQKQKIEQKMFTKKITDRVSNWEKIYQFGKRNGDENFTVC